MTTKIADRDLKLKSIQVSIRKAKQEDESSKSHTQVQRSGCHDSAKGQKDHNTILREFGN